ncbi:MULTISPECIES: NUDIX hydrolase [unclassified Streptomyces]|uniref:NUDIX hydrolase n=1 Tax=unclassified Streptomyces TaxID=2593676 RepID=UPI0036E896EF
MTGPADGSEGSDGKPTANGPVLAAGCVLWRRSERSGELEICLVHRPRYDDWSHPKGKLKRGEAALDGALREVLEETGRRCVPGAPLPTVRYTVNGRPKEVAYWAAEATGGAFVPNAEVDRVSWLSPAAARARLTRLHDRDVLDALLTSLPST